MANVSDILQQVAILLGRTNVSELTVNGFDCGLAGINQARQFAERQIDFKYAETNVYLNIASTGTSLAQVYPASPILDTVTVSSGGTPNVAGTYNLMGTYGGFGLYQNPPYILYHVALGYWIISDSFDYTNSFSFFSSNPDPTGSYPGQGTYSGTVTATASNPAVRVKRVKFVSLPVASGDYEPIEFLSNDQFISRVRMQIGRQAFNATKSLTVLGASSTLNPTAYQNANTLYLAGIPASDFPIVGQLNIVQWMPDYVATTDSDFFTVYGAEYLIWQTVLEINKKFKWLTVRQEGDVAEANAQAAATAALQTLIAWDAGIEDGTTEPHIAPNPAIIAAVSGQPS